MNTKPYKLILFFLTSILLFVASYIINVNEINKANYSINTKQIETILHKYETQLEKTVSDITTKISLQKNKSYKNTNWFFENINNIDNKKYTLLIYQNGTLKFWTNNTTPPPSNSKIINIKTNTVIKLKNGWYEIITKKTKNYNIIGLLKIKNNYYYDNKYLKSSFLIDSKIPSSVILSTSPISIGKNIKNNKGKYLFSLIPARNIDNGETNSQIPFILFYFSIVFLLLTANTFLIKLSDVKYSYILSAVITMLLSGTVILLLKFFSANFLSESPLLSESILSISFPFSTIGGLLVGASIILFISVNLFRIIPFEELAEKFIPKKKSYIYLFIISFINISFILSFYIFEISSVFSRNTNVLIDIRNILNINSSTIPSYIFIALIFFSFIFILDSFLKLSSRITNIKTTLISTFISFLSIFFLYAINIVVFNTLHIIIFYILTFLIILIRFIKQDYSYYSVISIVFIFSIFFVLFEDKNIQEKELIAQNNLINNLANERDEMAERFLREINNRLIQDSILSSKIINITEDQDAIIIEYLLRKYFYGFWEKYDLSVSLCGNSEFYGSENQASNCKGYYSDIFNEYGETVYNTIFWFINDNSGKITYTGLIEIPTHIDSRNIKLYITLYEKRVSKRLGYPKLLIDKSSISKTEYNKYSYAKYKNGILTVKSGEYSYDLDDKDFRSKKKKKYFIEKNGYKHLVSFNNTRQRIILSKEKEKHFDLVISFAYLFVFFNILVFTSIIFSDYRFAFKKFKFDFTNQIRFSMVFILLISFIIFGAGTVYFTIKQDEKVTNKEIADKVQSVLIELKHKLQNEDELSPSWHTNKYDHLDELLIKFSQVFFSDINLYDLDGHLLATSRSEIFNKGLIGKQMDTEAYKMMSIINKAEFIHKEKIGELEFLSIYIPLENEQNKVIAYINLPYFTKNDNLQNNISTVFIATLNLYVVLFLVTIFIAFIISTEITRPLRMLQSKFKAVQLGIKQQEIKYNKKDEIGELVKEYNLMVSKLEASAKKIAESERESAWREMAKQIAHEIKNPLTPMKLSIQFLQKSWFDKVDDTQDFEKRLNSVSETLIEQINTLSAIASEFSAFAKMPKTRKEEVNIVKKLQTVTSLFENTQNIDISLNLNKIENLNIIADKEQVSRVFINLIKNAIQAIPDNKKGKLKIILKESQTKATIIIEDNGKGIPNDKKERLFEPSFTTKTTGMGIGLAIVKNIVNSAGGDIWFDSKVNKGTRFYIEFLKM